MNQSRQDVKYMACCASITFWKMIMNRCVHSLLFFLIFTLYEGDVHASGRRGLVLTQASISKFQSVKAEMILNKRPRYIGSTAEWHLFMRVETSFGGGMPYSHLFTYKVAKKDLQVVHAWDIKVFDRYIEAQLCPEFRIVKGKSGQIEVPLKTSIRKQCGTGA